MCYNIWSELQALLIALQHVWIHGFQNVGFEGDNKYVHQLRTNIVKNFKVHNLIRDIKYWSSRFDSIHFQWVHRHYCNKKGDRFTKEPIFLSVTFVSHFYLPIYLVQILHENHTCSISFWLNLHKIN